MSSPGPAPSLLISDIEEDRHGSGILFVSYDFIERPDQNYLSSLSAYDCNKLMKRYFCGTCGCHVLRKRLTYDPDSELRDRALGYPSPSLSTTATTGGDTPDAGSSAKEVSGEATPVGGGVLLKHEALADMLMREPPSFNLQYDGGGQEYFEVATGVIFESPRIDKDVRSLANSTVDTIDGGLAPWLSRSNILNLKGRSQIDTRLDVGPPSQSMPAFCQCGKVQLKIFRPQDIFKDEGAHYPDSPYPDLMYPSKTTPKSTVDNPSKERWYLRHNKTKYLAGTCACRSCRLTTGYEVQTWAFIPRAAIHISLTSRPPSSPFSDDYSPPDPGSYVPLDFEELDRQPAKPLRSYEPSPGVFREFCPGCGATVFWHDKVRPDLIDVSVGLLHASEGARAESLLEWWRGRCSFAEDAGLGRTGWIKGWSEGLIKDLEQGMKI